MTILSKSRFMSGYQCEKKLFFDVYQHVKPVVSDEQQALFELGHRLGHLAQKVFPGGLHATDDNQGSMQISIESTNKWLSEDIETIYEDSFSIEGGFASIDILHNHNGQRWAIEVKNSTSVKDYHIMDASFQYFVMHQSGYSPDKMFLMLIDKNYIKQNDIIPVELFQRVDITDQVLANQEFISDKHMYFLSLLGIEKEPTKEIGQHCSDPFDCGYMHHCWSHLPENHVFNLYNARGKDWKLYQDGIYSLSEVPEDFSLNHRQSLQIRGVKYNEQHIDLMKIREFLQPLEGDLYFFDFETINPAIPILNGTRPYDQIPFQYSMHKTDLNGNVISHSEFLANPADFSDSMADNPRLQLVRQLKNDIGHSGHIVAYNASFEIGRLKELSVAFPEESEFISSIIDRFFDLIIPFRSGWYYKPEMGASASIKYVLPSIAPEFSYQDLEIYIGGIASNTYFTMVEKSFTGDYEQTIQNLKAYCKRDTEGMVIIYSHLRELCRLNQ